MANMNQEESSLLNSINSNLPNHPCMFFIIQELGQIQNYSGEEKAST